MREVMKGLRAFVSDKRVAPTATWRRRKKESEYRLGAGFRKVGGPIPGLLLADKGERSPPTEKGGGATSPGRWSNLKWWECTSWGSPWKVSAYPCCACTHRVYHLYSHISHACTWVCTHLISMRAHLCPCTHTTSPPEVLSHSFFSRLASDPPTSSLLTGHFL